MDVPNVCTYIYWNTGIYLRPFVDKIHFRLPFNKHFFTWLGGIEGTRENCETLMKAGCPLLVYPGGASENLKDERIPKYLLLWKDHVGFAKMAAKHNYTIIPFSSVGFEDMFQIWFSIPSYYIFTLLGDSRAKKERVLHKQASKNTPPPTPHQTFSKGYKAPPFPDTRIPIYAPWTFRPQSNYCVFGTPIETTNFDADDSESVFALRDVVRDAVEKCVEQAKEMQASDTERTFYDAFMALADFDDLSFKPPPNWLIYLFAKPWHILFPVKCEGLENIPKDGRFLLVGNHQNWVSDCILFLSFVYWETGHFIHGTIPIHKHIFRYAGGIFASPEKCSVMMDHNTPLLVYPGGAIENWKDERIPKYTLMWKDRAGFAKLAAKHGYTIVPFASVGFEDMAEIWFSIPAHYFLSFCGDHGRAELERRRSSRKSSHPDISKPRFSKGYIAPPVPDCRLPIYKPWTFRPQSNYIVFGPAIETRGVDLSDAESVFELRDHVRDAVEKGIRRGLDMQRNDTQRYTTLKTVWSAIIGNKEKS
ncbi:hypothetical protein HDU79_000556 [Rhizoclosmatium sp. JEL0117]|nr:hypothetical protein HDU79_000556 [Rhizoclosmatium sp. JEL0117]